MPADGMPYADRSAQPQRFRDHRRVLAKVTPMIGVEVFIAAPVASQVDGKAVTTGKLLDDAVPEAGVKTGGVGEQNRRPGTRPLPNGQFLDAKQMHVQ